MSTYLNSKPGTYSAHSKHGWFTTRYRIVRDNYSGYEVQIRRWWFPIWLQLGGINTSPSIERARELIDWHRSDHRPRIVEHY